MEVYTREKQLEIFKTERERMDTFLVYEMHRAIGTEGENDIAQACRNAQKALYSLEMTLRNYHNPE